MQKLKFALVATVFLLLFLPTSAFSQGSEAEAQRRWPGFWHEFSTAVKKKDVVALKRLMPDDFFDGGGGMKAGEWLTYMNESEKKGSWRDFQKSIARGAVVNKKFSKKGVPTRVTRDNAYYFEFRNGKKWYFAGLVGD